MTETMTQDVAVIEPMPIAKTAQLMSMTDIQATAKAIVTSKMIAGVTNESEAIVKILAGQELGLGPIAAVNGLYVLNGRVGMMVSIAGALLRKQGWQWVTSWDDQDNPTVCEIIFKHPVLKSEGSVPYRWTVSDSIRAKLIKQDGAHQKYPKAMLFNRAFMAGARIEAPDCLLNMGYEYDELREATAPPHVASATTSAPPVSAPPKPAAAPAAIANIPIVNVDSIDCPLHPGTEARLNKWGSAYSHPTGSKNAEGKTVWCNTKIADLHKPPACVAIPTEDKTPPAGLEVPKTPPQADLRDWTSKAKFDESKDALMLRLEWPKAKVLEHIKSAGLLNATGLITIANRGKIIQELESLCEREGK